MRDLRGNPEDWLAWLVSSDEEKRDEAILILGGLDPKDEIAIEPFVRALCSRENDLAFWCSIALGCLGHSATQAIPQLAKVAAEHDQFGTRQAAVRALGQIGPRDAQAKGAVFRAFGDAEPFVRREALQAIIEFEGLSEDEIGHIKSMAQDEDSAVARWSEIAVRNIRLKNSPQGCLQDEG